MRNKRGFTLVELLVVMAIIAILAAIVVPNAAKFIARAKVTRALAEIQGMETAITAMVTDAGRSSLGQVFAVGKVPAYVTPSEVNQWGHVPRDKWLLVAAGNLGQAVEIYSSVVYELLQSGRNVLQDSNSLAITCVDRNVLSKLGTGYMEVGNDSWGGTYQILPGPWSIPTPPAMTVPIPVLLRKFSVDTGTSNRKVKADPYCLRGGVADYITNDPSIQSIIGDDYLTWPDKVAYPADTSKSMYIWSFGANMRSSQMLYTAAFDAGQPATWYPNAQDGSDIGGGDDVNNWDKDTTWSRFTN